MFDANARHLPDGKLFFAECHSIDPESNTLNFLFKAGRSYLCEKFDGNPDCCRFKLYFNNHEHDWIIVKVDFDDEENFDDYSLFVYSGRPDGTGFIDKEWKQKALDFLGGEWYE